MSMLPASIALLRHARLADGALVDVVIEGATVADIVPAGTAPLPSDANTVVDLDGFLLMTAAAEPHAHLDKTRSWDAIRPPMGDLELAIESWRAYAATMTVEDVAERARTQALAMLAKGTTAIRTHVDILLGDEPLRGVHALLQVRDELADLIDIEIVALPGPDIASAAVEAALDAGVDVVGGAPHLAPEPLDDLRRLLEIAERRGLPVDLHTDESLDGAVTLGEYARIVASWSQNTSAGHCVRLGTLPATERDGLVSAVVAAGIGVIANPITNLYLQGWGDDVATPRGLTAVRALVDAKARFAAGADNVRDPFNPLGRSDPFETAMLLVTAGHLTVDEAWAAVSDGAREVLALPTAGVTVGAAAELLAVRGQSLPEVVAEASAERLVIHRGRLVARTTVSTEVAVPTAHLTPTGAR